VDACAVELIVNIDANISTPIAIDLLHIFSTELKLFTFVTPLFGDAVAVIN
jgi:hypothetical protein